jgi:filamentous hemagglutinin
VVRGIGRAAHPTLLLPNTLRNDLTVVSDGLIKADNRIALAAQTLDNTGFVVSGDELAIDADEVLNRKRLADYRERTYEARGYTDHWGQTVQPGGFMQAAQWSLDTDRVASVSGEFRVLGAGRFD